MDCLLNMHIEAQNRVETDRDLYSLFLHGGARYAMGPRTGWARERGWAREQGWARIKGWAAARKTK